MYCTRNVSEAVVWVGGCDRRLALFENLFPVPRGVAYNSYLIIDEKTALIDTVDSAISRQFLENILHTLNGRPLDYLVVNHMEPDHCANIEELLRLFPALKVVGKDVYKRQQVYKGKWVQVDGAWQYRGEIKGTEEIDGKSVSVVIKDYADLMALSNTKLGTDIQMLVDALDMPSILMGYQGSYIQDFDTMKYSLLKVPVFLTGQIDIESGDALFSKYIHFNEVTRITLHNNFIKNNKWLQGIEGVE